MSFHYREKSIGRRIAQLFRESQLYLAREMAVFGIGTGQYMLLVELFHEDGLSQEELAERVRIDKANVARGVSRLAQAGYVRRVRDAYDKRVNRIRLTPKAREIKEPFLAVLRGWSEILTRGFTDEERDALVRKLVRLERNAVAQRG